MLVLPAILLHSESARFARGLVQLVSAQPSMVVADASHLEHFDSSALAVLLACRRAALAAGKSFAVHGLPAKLGQLAGLYGIKELIPASA